MSNYANLIDEIIPERNKNERIWVVRASGGRYVQHFVKDNLVAIGHIDGLEVQNNPRQIALADLKSYLARTTKDGQRPSKATVSNMANQVSSFITEIKSGDLILTLDTNQVAVGRISSDAYCDTKGIEIRNGKRVSVMPFQLRRQVVWGPSLDRKQLPYSIEASLKAHQTVFSLDGHWEILYHFLFPIFRDQEHIYFSSNIDQQKDINSYSVSQLLGLFSDLEAIVKVFDPVRSETYEELISRFRSDHNFSLTCKAEFMSKGHIWTKLGLSKSEGKKLLYFLVAWGTLFGHVKFADVFEIDVGIITPEIRAQISKQVLDAIAKRDANDVKDKLKLNIPHHNVDPIRRGPENRTIEM